MSLSRSSVSLGGDPGLQSFEWSVLGEGLDRNSVTHDFASLLESHEISHSMFGETVFTADENHLTAWELILGASEGEFGDMDEFWLGSD